MDLIPRFYRSDIQESILIKGSCGSFRIRPRSQLQNSLNTSIESNKYLEKVLKSSNKQLKPVKQERNTSTSFNLPSYTDSIYLPDVSSSSKFKASPFITISPKIKPVKRVPAADFLPLKSETDTDGMASHECGPSAVNLYYEGRLARPSFVKKTPFKPPKKMFLGPELLKK